MASHRRAGIAHSAIHACIYPLAFGVVAADDKTGLAERCLDAIGQRVRAAHALDAPYNFSVAAAPFLFAALYRFPAADYGAIALDVLTSCGHDSWCRMIRDGATATMEAWTRAEKPNQLERAGPARRAPSPTAWWAYAPSSRALA